jgi:hypothetical protein
MTEPAYSCPSCHAEIPLDDVNVAKDVALCRACGRATPFSLISGTAEVSLDALDEPPKSVRVEQGFGDEMSIVYHRLSPVLLFLIPFTAFWSGFSMWGIYGKQIMAGTFNLSESLFGLPFLFGTIILLGIIAYLMFGKWVVKLSHGEATVFVGVGLFGRTRRFSYNRNTTVSMSMTGVKVNDRPQPGILVRTDDKDFLFGALLPANARQFIAAAIAKQVAETR